MNRFYRVVMGWWLDPIVEMWAEILGYYDAKGASEFERKLDLMGLSDERKEDIRQGAILLAQSGWTAAEFQAALVKWVSFSMPDFPGLTQGFAETNTTVITVSPEL